MWKWELKQYYEFYGKINIFPSNQLFYKTKETMICWAFYVKLYTFIRESKVFSKAVSKKLISRNFGFWREKIIRFSSTVHKAHCKKREILSYRKNISWNQLFSNFLVKTLLSRNFCQKCVRECVHSVKICKFSPHDILQKFRQIQAPVRTFLLCFEAPVAVFSKCKQIFCK